MVVVSVMIKYTYNAHEFVSTTYCGINVMKMWMEINSYDVDLDEFLVIRFKMEMSTELSLKV